ncbi:PREDICTED: uncharacterized protein LOC104817156 [Tarenaya hassleriana]|uniref:uncharacterized protein LOC104817156 n=1 Tax=Tarenaya hassleriana TaxID=28532 RepID=UPI00053C6031|nr:PREDICTED: uncharacterized protein LOC104817156 [Tarenaya hassleriana]
MATRKSGARPASRPCVRHPGHTHPLRLFKAKDEHEVVCSGCELELVGPAFKCTKSECDYFLHKSCFELPRQTYHKSHPDHPLTLVHSPPYSQSIYTCDACGEYGTGFTYSCSECQFDVHVGCVSLPETMERDDHEHPLTLLYCSPYKDNVGDFVCDVCRETVPENFWVYYCKECDYGTHVHSCMAYEETKEEEEEGEEEEEEGGDNGGIKEKTDSTVAAMSSMLDAQRQMQMMQLQTQMAFQRAQMIRDMGRSMVNLV